MQSKMNEEQLKLLIRAFLALEDEQETENLLADLCTIREVQDLGQRIEVARLLRKQTTYTDIAQMTGASTATISRVNRCLMYGAGGYKSILDKLEKGEEEAK